MPDLIPRGVPDELQVYWEPDDSASAMPVGQTNIQSLSLRDKPNVPAENMTAGRHRRRKKRGCLAPDKNAMRLRYNRETAGHTPHRGAAQYWFAAGWETAADRSGIAACFEAAAGGRTAVAAGFGVVAGAAPASAAAVADYASGSGAWPAAFSWRDSDLRRSEPHHHPDAGRQRRRKTKTEPRRPRQLPQRAHLPRWFSRSQFVLPGRCPLLDIGYPPLTPRYCSGRDLRAYPTLERYYPKSADHAPRPLRWRAVQAESSCSRPDKLHRRATASP